MQKMTGRSRSESSSSLTSSQNLHRSGSDELTNRMSISEIILEENSLDYVHPILEDDDGPILMASFGSESPPDGELRGDNPIKPSWESKNSPVFYENEIEQCAPIVPRRRTKAVSGRNCISQYPPFPTSVSNSHSKVLSPHSSNGSSSGGGDADSRLCQPPVIKLVCSSPDSGVHIDCLNSHSTQTSHSHSPVSSCKLAHSHASSKSVHSHAIIVNENKGESHFSTAASNSSISHSSDTDSTKLNSHQARDFVLH